jgi:hypothetical protein
MRARRPRRRIAQPFSPSGPCGHEHRAPPYSRRVNYLDFTERVLAHYISSGLAERPWVTLRELAQGMGLEQRQIHDPVDDLAAIDIFDLDAVGTIRPNDNTDRILQGATLRGAWPQFFNNRFLTPEQEQFLTMAVELGQREGEADAEMQRTEASDVYEALGWASLDDPDVLRLANALEQRGHIVKWAFLNNNVTVRVRYAGVVRATQRVASQWQEKLETLLAEGETATIEVKRQLDLKSEKQKAEFVRDVLGLATTKASGRERYLIIGFDNKTLDFDPAITREQLEQIINAYTDPKPALHWVTVPVSGGTAGVVVVKRDPAKVPYRISRDVWKLKANSVYVRHGTHTEAPTDQEVLDLVEEGDRARASS